MLPVFIPILVGNRKVIKGNLSSLGRVETGDKFDQGGLTGTIAANTENQFTGMNIQVDWAEQKAAIFSFPIITVRDSV